TEKLYLKNRRYFLYPAAGILLLFSLLTWQRNYELNDPIKIWSAGVRNEPKHIGNWVNLAIVYKNQGNLKKAKKLIQSIPGLSEYNNDEQANLYITLGEIYFLEKNYEQSLNILNKALSLNPIVPVKWVIYYGLGNVFEALGNDAQALINWEKASKLNPASWETYEKIGSFFLQRKDFIKAKKYIDKTVRLNPNYSSLFLLARFYEVEGNYQTAVKAYRQSIKLKPDWFQSHYNLCLLYAKLQDSRCFDELSETLRLNPEFIPAQSLFHSLKKPNTRPQCIFEQH
ncbi:MAG: tetratricopeptide repeat protein, partial [Candidatus Omnitrophota bacterium]